MAVLTARNVALGVLGTAAIVGTGLAIAQDQVSPRLRSAVPADDPESPEYLAALVGATQVSHGNEYEVLTNGDEMFPAMLRAINKAQHRISLETYIYKKGYLADVFTAALERAAHRGVRVNIIVDHFGSQAMPTSHVDRLRTAGCAVARFNQSRWYTLEEVNYRTHRKILVVDGQTAFTGGAGVADDWMGNAQDPDHWRDTQFRLRGPIALLIEGAFYENLLEQDAVLTPDLRAETAQTIDAEGSGLIVSSGAGVGISDLKRLYLMLIAMSRRSLEITSPYFIPDASTLWVLRDAAARGVRVRILTDGDITDAVPVKHASRASYERLLSCGIEIHEYRRTLMHAKTIVVDGVWSLFGSANFDNRSLELNDELNVAVWNRALASDVLRDFECDLQASERIDLETWRRRPQLERLREGFWSYFSEVF